jgi:hypothetical protein
LTGVPCASDFDGHPSWSTATDVILEEGAQLVSEWGKDAGRRLAIVRTRLDRMMRSGGGMEAAGRFFDELPAAQAKAVLAALAWSR